MSYCSRSRRRRFTVLNFKCWARSRVYCHFQQHLYCACTETVIYELQCKLRHRHLIRRPRFPIRVYKISAIWWRFPLIFLILYAECPPYFYFRFVWTTDPESTPHASTPTSIIPTKFEVATTTHCRVIGFLSANTARDLVTLTFDLLTLNSWRAWQVMWPTLPPSLKTIRLFFHELRVITFPLVTIENAHAATAHAPNHVTRE